MLEAEWAFLSRPERVLELSDKLLDMKPIGQDRILPIDAIPMRILPNFNDQLADVGEITLLPAEDDLEALPVPPVSATRISATADLRIIKEDVTR